jgi:hypothetical protein
MGQAVESPTTGSLPYLGRFQPFGRVRFLCVSFVPRLNWSRLLPFDPVGWEWGCRERPWELFEADR